MKSAARRIAASLFSMIASIAAAQVADTGAIQGVVTDQTGAAVGGVSVDLTAVRFARHLSTGADGSFYAGSLKLDRVYKVTARREGFADAQADGITLQSGVTARIEIVIAIAAGRTRITVNGGAGEVRTDVPQLSMRISGRQLEETPMLSRRITYLALLNSANRPAINQGDVFTNQSLFTTNGAGRRQTSFAIDGGSGNDSWGRQTIFANVPLAAIQEFTIVNNSFSVTYGGGTGSAVNIVTRTGGDQFRAQFVNVWRPAVTQASLAGFTARNAPNGNALTSNTLTQSSLSIGGPAEILRRTYFYLAAEASRENRSSPVTSPLAPGTFTGRYRGQLGFARLDRQISDGGTIFLRVNADMFYDTNPNGTVGGNNLPSVGRVFRRRTYSAQAGETQVISPRMFNELRLQFQLGSPITQFDPVRYGTQYQVPISSGGTFTSGTSQSALLQNRQYEVNDALSLIRGRHSLKIGASVMAVHTGGNSKEFGGPLYLGRFVYNVCTEPLAFCESPSFLNDIANVRSYTQSFGAGSYVVRDYQWAMFAQEDYRVRRDLTVNLGLRYEQQRFTDFRRGFAPRVGLSYNLLGNASTVFRGGYGIYYSQIPDNAQANYSLGGPEGVFTFSAAPGQPGFPASVASLPSSRLPDGAAIPVRDLYIRPGDGRYLARFIPTGVLRSYPDRLLNPYSQQWNLGVERRLASAWNLRADYVGSHTLRINRPLDVNSPESFVRTAPGQVRSAQNANCTRPYWIWWYAQHGGTCGTAGAAQPPYGLILSDTNNGFAFYDALQVNLSGHIGRKLTFTGSYTWSHTIDNTDPDVPGQNPNDPNLTQLEEKAPAVFDQRHRLVISGVGVSRWGLHVGGIVTVASGLPYNIVTGVNNSGDIGGTTDRPVIGGSVIARNAGRGTPTYDVSPLLERPFLFRRHLRLEPRVEVFNLLNHQNFVGFSGTWGNDARPGPGFGQRLPALPVSFPPDRYNFRLRSCSDNGGTLSRKAGIFACAGRSLGWRHPATRGSIREDRPGQNAISGNYCGALPANSAERGMPLRFRSALKS